MLIIPEVSESFFKEVEFFVLNRYFISRYVSDNYAIDCDIQMHILFTVNTEYANILKNNPFSLNRNIFWHRKSKGRLTSPLEVILPWLMLSVSILIVLL